MAKDKIKDDRMFKYADDGRSLKFSDEVVKESESKNRSMEEFDKEIEKLFGTTDEEW